MKIDETIKEALVANSKVAECSEQSDEGNEILCWQWLQMKRLINNNNNNNNHLKIIQTILEQQTGKAQNQATTGGRGKKTAILGTSHIIKC
jgi:hypothetical protein